MSWTYTQNPANSDKDAVRFLVGQTSTNDPVLISDQEIDYVLTQEGGVYCAAAAVGRTMLQRFSAVDPLSLTVGNLSETYGDRSQRLQDALRGLERQCQLRNALPSAGGVILADKIAREADTTLTPHVFAIGMNDNPSGMVNDVPEND